MKMRQFNKSQPTGNRLYLTVRSPILCIIMSLYPGSMKICLYALLKRRPLNPIDRIWFAAIGAAILPAKSVRKINLDMHIFVICFVNL